ncbi:tyrosyl-tRNA synthetase [Cryptosporidium ubiquitum]|uniref:Tyrosyl-tRNA synthetase n=1 Tax=Cryptosporidium ubiquitum TaxID=857276 RepID=A0A1J4MDZ7_9CRYT|nr:tyrosyl-tRNA synthetase [Cryptosporidium ubiquitum]OII72215.1 tyrosyl-tRNA synthetase [Cryptosporidium ubiquitum]
MGILIKYSKTTNIGKAIALVINYLLKQNTELKIEESIIDGDINESNSKIVLIKDKENCNDQLENIVDILIHLGSLGKNLLGKDSSLVNESKEILQKLVEINFKFSKGPEMSEFNEKIKGKSFFLGRSLTIVDLVIYISLYSYFESLKNEGQDYVPEYPNLSTFFEQIQIVTQIRQSCPENIIYLDLPFFKKKLVKKEKKNTGDNGNNNNNNNKQEERPLDDPTRIALRVGRILSVERHPTADKLYLEKIDVGEEEPRTILSGLVGIYDLTQKINQLVVIVSNLKPRAMRGITSNGMLLCASSALSEESSNNNQEESPKRFCEPVSVPKDAKVGELIFYNDFKGEPDTVLNTKTGKDPFVAVQPHYNVSGELICRFKESTMMTSAGPIFVENKSLAHGSLS